MSESPQPAAVVYGCLSKAGEDESIESQHAKAFERLAQVHPDGYELLAEPFSDNGVSGSKRNRGRGLQAAIDTATTAAEAGRYVELWANTSARFARGKGRKDEARSLLELFTQMNRAGVRLRTVADDDMLREELVGINSRMAAKYSEDLSESVRRSKVRQAEKGQHPGGVLADGWRVVKDEHGGRTWVHDPERAPVVAHIFELADQGMPDGVLARQVNAEGYRTAAGRPYDRRAIQNIVTNAWHAGRVVLRRGQPTEEVFQGHHEPLVDPDTFDRIQRARAQRDLGRGRHERGRPAHRHLLARLAVCACGESMYSFTSAHKRKDGTRQRQYQCAHYRRSTGLCDTRYDAEAIDQAVLERLHDLLPDFERWIANIEDRHGDERKRLVGIVQRAQEERDRQARKVEAVERKWADYVGDGDDAKADLTLPILERERQALTDADTRLSATQGALDSVPAEAPHDHLFDFAANLRAAVRGRLEGAHSMQQANRALLECFEAFVLIPAAPVHPDADVVEAGGVMIEPILRRELATKLFERTGFMDGKVPPPPQSPPPLEWIEALRYSADPHE